MALRLCGIPEGSAVGRARLAADAPLITSGLVVVEDPDRPFLSRSLRVPDRVVSHLLGDDRLDPALVDVVRVGTETANLPGRDLLAKAIEGGVRLMYLCERSGCGAPELANAALSRAGFATLLLDIAVPPTGPERTDLIRAVLREALLRGAGIVVGPGRMPPGRPRHWPGWRIPRFLLSYMARRCGIHSGASSRPCSTRSACCRSSTARTSGVPVSPAG